MPRFHHSFSLPLFKWRLKFGPTKKTLQISTTFRKMYMSCDVAREGQKGGGGRQRQTNEMSFLFFHVSFFFPRTSDKSISSTRFCSIANTLVISWLRENDTGSSADVLCALGRLIYLAKRKSVWINNRGKGRVDFILSNANQKNMDDFTRWFPIFFIWR